MLSKAGEERESSSDYGEESAVNDGEGKKKAGFSIEVVPLYNFKKSGK